MAVAKVLVFIFFCVGVRVIALTGKAYYCRDPDTGKLYPVNSTWPSSTFCGNYICKLRKKISNATKLPLREFNITKLEAPLNDKFEDSNSILDTLPLASENQITIDSSNDPLDSTETKYKTADDNILSKLLEHRLDKLKIKAENVDSGDRYLTESEIKAISELLHNVKKSDLEVIVDIYSLAQDIYKEMDKMTSENVLEETIKSAKTKHVEAARQSSSYWYEPLHKHNLPLDMELQGSNAITTTQDANVPTTQPKSKHESLSYFPGPLSRSDFGTLPYYYPMSYFQRQSSYVNPTHNSQYPTTVNYRPAGYTQTQIPNYTRLGMPFVQPSKPCSGNKAPPPSRMEKPSSGLLPYPYSYIHQHYNTSSYPFDFYFKSSPWLQSPENVKTKQNKPQLKGYISQIPDNEILTFPDGETLQISKHTEEHKPVVENDLLGSLLTKVKPKPKNRPDWQTDSISAQVLEEVRALFQEKAKLVKPVSIRKKVKIERVGKVHKLDEGKRNKRDTTKQETEKELGDEYEAYTEKTTCLSDEQPGFFRMGNVTEPFPACCPQRIDDDAR